LSSEKPPRKRTLAMWILYIVFAWVAFAGFMRMGYSISNWYWLDFAHIHPGPWYLAASGGLWGVAGGVAWLWLWLSLPWSRQVGSGAALFFSAWYWIDRLFIGNPQSGLPNAGFSALLTFIGLAFVFLVLRPWRDWKNHKER